MMATKNVKVNFDLSDRTIDGEAILALKNLWVSPGEHLLQALRMIEAIADGLPVIGFTEPRSANIYASCDWCVANYQNRVLVSSEQIDMSKFNEEPW